jgi:hypothetical protein
MFLSYRRRSREGVHYNTSPNSHRWRRPLATMSILIIINVVLAVIFQCCIVLPKTHAANTVKPKNCPPGTYYSGVSFITGLPACYACPNTLEDCKNEKIADVKTCQTSCGKRIFSSICARGRVPFIFVFILAVNASILRNIVSALSRFRSS